MSFSTLTFCARVWNIANMLRYKVVSGEMFLAALASLALTAHAWVNQPETRMLRAAETAETWSHYTCHVYCEPFNVRHVSHLCVSLQQRKNLCKYKSQICTSCCSSFELFIVQRSSNYDNYAVITDVAEVKKNITFNSDTFVHVLRRCNKNDNL